MTGELMIVAVVVLVIAVLLIAWVVQQQVKIVREAQQTTRDLITLVSKQSAIIASNDALAYQAIQAMDAVRSYDDSSAKPDEEEIDYGAEYGEPAAAGHGEDPFVTGNVFESRL